MKMANLAAAVFAAAMAVLVTSLPAVAEDGVSNDKIVSGGQEWSRRRAVAEAGSTCDAAAGVYCIFWP
jgi:hypothetical protein